MRAGGGPCGHCGTLATPCWRKGPPEKPCLCNACGSRYLVKGNLVGYYPGSRRSSNPARSGAEHAPSVVISKGPRKAALSVAAGAKRKSGDIDRFEGQAQRIHSDYEALETLRFALSVRGRSLYQARGSGTTASDSSDHHTQQEDFKEFNLDASSDDYQETAHDSGAMPALFHQLTGVVAPQQPVHRRPRKQLRPVACSC